MSEPELHASGLPVAVMTIREGIYRHHGAKAKRCYAWKQTGPAELGVLAFDVCGLGRGHFGSHQAGWTGTGRFFDTDDAGES